MDFIFPTLIAETPTQIRNCYGYMWSGVNLMGRSYFWHNPPDFFRCQKRKFYYDANGHFLLYYALRNPPMEIREIIGDIPGVPKKRTPGLF